MPRVRTTFALLAAVALAACSGDRINTVSYDSYAGSYLGDAASKGEVPVRVLGAPAAGVSQDAAAARIGDAMHGANVGPVVDYAVYQGETLDGYVMVARFGQGAPARQICQDGAPSGVGPDYALAFCKDGYALSYLTGRVGDADIDSPGFRRAFQTAAIELLPLENPEFFDCDVEDCD